MTLIAKNSTWLIARTTTYHDSHRVHANFGTVKDVARHWDKKGKILVLLFELLINTCLVHRYSLQKLVEVEVE